MSAILQGENPKESEIPPFVSEYFLAQEFKWTIEYTRSLPYHIVDMLTSIIALKYKLEKSGKDTKSQGLRGMIQV